MLYRMRILRTGWANDMCLRLSLGVRMNVCRMKGLGATRTYDAHEEDLLEAKAEDAADVGACTLLIDTTSAIKSRVVAKGAFKDSAHGH